MRGTFETIRGHTIYTPSLSAASVILDLGANRGEFAKQMSARYGGKYYLVEANPLLAEVLRSDGRFPVWQCAVADTEGPIRFQIAEDEEGSSLLALPAQSVRGAVLGAVLRETIEVQARTLESLLTEIHAPRIDLVKMDIEGAEVMVLRSLSGATLRTIGQIAVEFHGDPRFGFGLHRDVEEVVRFLRRSGFLCLNFSRRPRRDVLLLNRAVHRIPVLQRLVWQLWAIRPFWLWRIWDRLPPSFKRRIRRLWGEP